MTIMEEIDKFNFAQGTIGTLLSLCCKVTTEEEAKHLLEKYREAEPRFADQNLGYIFGYCDDKTRERLYRLFPVSHPVFGAGFGRGSDPSPEAAFAAGKRNILRTKLQGDKT